MELLERFKDYLRENGKSDITVKNYLSDVRRFIGWFEETHPHGFIIQAITSEHIKQYRTLLSSSFDRASTKRHGSSLNQFFVFLTKSNLIASNAIEIYKEANESQLDGVLRLRDFRSFLYENRASELTVKNYLADISQFTKWAKAVLALPDNQISEKMFFSKLNIGLLNTYKERLLTEKQLSPVSINRKLSSLRSYLKFASKYGLIDQESTIPENLAEDGSNVIGAGAYEQLLTNQSEPEIQPLPQKNYSPFPPYRVLQKLGRLSMLGLDLALIVPLADGFLVCQKLAWKLSGGRIFYTAAKKSLKRTRLDSLLVDNFAKGFYAPLSVSLASLPLHKRVFLLLRHKRPLWYKRYHTYAVAHYLHFGILGISVIVMGSLLYSRLAPSVDQRVLGSGVVASGRELQFKGLLVDSDAHPITKTTPLRFTLYDDKTASGSSVLWEDVQTVTPDTQGSFSVSLGKSLPLPASIFAGGEHIYLGIAIGNTEELKPRQPIPNVHLAQDAQRVGGLVPITADNAGSQNVLLALDSAGNLTIGNTSPIFQATDGVFTLRAQSLVLSALPGSNGSIVLSPDGFGSVDITKAIQNTSNNGSLPDTLGAVEVADSFAILATASGQSALTISQNGNGPIISASASGIAKFTVDNTGSGYFANNLKLNGTDLATDQFAINIFNRNAQIINLGGEAIAITIGSQSGTTTIRTPSTNLQGNLAISGKTGMIFSGENAGITFSGNGNHILKAESGVLRLGSQLEIGKDVTILPQGSDGTNNLGSATNPFDTIYVNNIVSSSLNGQPNFWATQDGVLRPVDVSNDIVIGGNSTSSASWQVFGSGQNEGTASSSGNLTFTGINTNINQLNGGTMTFRTSSNGDNNLTSQLTISASGIGIGNTTPQFRLDVQDSKSAKAAAMISNLDTGATADVLDLQLGAATVNNTNHFLRFLNGSGVVIGSIQGNNVGGVQYNATGGDFAEYFLKHDSQEIFTAGNIVCLHSDGGVTKCTQSQSSIVGVVSDRPGFVGNGGRQHDDSYVLVGLSGQVPVLVSNQNGSIAPSDRLTISNTPGVAAKALGPSPIVGQALEPQVDGVARVNTYIKATWYDPTPRTLSDTGDLQYTLQKSLDEQGESYIVKDTLQNTLVEIIGTFSEAIIGKLAAGIITSKEFTTEQAEVTKHLLAKLISVQKLIVSDVLISPLAQIDNLQVHIISPLSGKDGLSLVFEKDRIAIVDPVSSKTALLVDREGNAEFAGNISAPSASVSGNINTDGLAVESDATIGGTLRVRNLIADNIIGASSSATYVTNVTNIYQSSSSGVPTPTPTVALASTETGTPSASSLLAGTLTTDFQHSASFSGLLANNTLTVDFAHITNGLMVFGPASFADISTAGQIAIGGKLILADGTINMLGSDLELQSLRQGNLTIMGGLVRIDTEGNLFVSGNAEFAKNLSVKGKLSTNLIAPVPDSDLVVQLGGTNHNDQETNTQSPGFAVSNASGSAIFRVNALGDLIASGSGKFMQLMANNFNLVRGAQADTSVTQTTASASAGTATINKGQRERTIISPYVTEQSLIYLTPTSDTSGVTPYVARQTPQSPQLDSIGSFTIQITRPVASDINLNWWIIN